MGESPILKDTRVKWSRKVISICLPQEFRVRYLGGKRTEDPFGYTVAKKAVDSIVSAAKKKAEQDPKFVSTLYSVDLIIHEKGVDIYGLIGKKVAAFFPVQSIGYGMQDSVHNRIFSMIQRREDGSCICHIFLCSSGRQAFQLTEALAGTFDLLRRKELEKSYPKRAGSVSTLI